MLRHAWITGCRRSDAPVSKAPANFTQAVEEVKQWNKALKSSEHNLRTSISSDSSGPPRVPTHGNRPGLAPGKGHLALAKPRPTAADFRSPERADDDNWDNDFATNIALHNLPHIKGQDNFGGQFSGDKLKAFASIDGHREDSDNWDGDFSSDLLTIKGPRHWSDFDAQEQTIRPLPRKTEKAPETKPHSHKRQKSSRTAAPTISQPKSPIGGQFGNKFQLPPRPDLMYREQSVEDYSDLFDDNDHVFNNRLSIVTKVSMHARRLLAVLTLYRMRLNSSTPRTSPACRGPRSPQWWGASGGKRHHAPPSWTTSQ